MKLSVIIPVYNTEHTLNRCMESVCRQGYDNMEVIIVDDGSTDKSPALCDYWAAQHDEIKVIHQKNGGLSDARNRGLSEACGEYITFVDSDDVIEELTYTKLMHYLAQNSQTDILEFPVKIIKNERETSNLEFTPQIYRNQEDYWIKGEGYRHCYAWNKIYKRECIPEDIFPKGYLFEDVYAITAILRKNPVIETINIGKYIYIINNKGITSNADGDAWRLLLKAYVDMQKQIRFKEIVCKYTAKDISKYTSYLLNIQLEEYLLTGDKPSITYYPMSILHAPYKIKAIILKIFGLKVLCNMTHLINQAANSRL